MRIAAISKLKAKLSEHLAWVKRGEEVVVTERGKPVARIVPLTGDVLGDGRIGHLIARGVLRPGRGDLRDILSRLRRYEAPEGAVLRAFEQAREDRG